MKINIISDLHVDRGIYETPFIKSDLLIIAGDIASVSTQEYINFVHSIPQEQRTIIIMGNHEPLKYAHNKAEDKIREIIADLKHITLLENSSIVINGIRFLGTTLWSDFMSAGKEHYHSNKEKIEKSFKFPEDHIWDENKQQKEPIMGCFSESKTKKAQKYLIEQMSSKFDGKTVVITHFPPSKKSAETAYIGDTLSAYWINDYEYLFDYAPDIWIHGHIHESKDYTTLKGTRVLCNPRGNVKKVVNKTYDHSFCIDI